MMNEKERIEFERVKKFEEAVITFAKAQTGKNTMSSAELNKYREIYRKMNSIVEPVRSEQDPDYPAIFEKKEEKRGPVDALINKEKKSIHEEVTKKRGRVAKKR